MMNIKLLPKLYILSLIFVSVLSASATAQSMTENIFRYYKFNETTGNVIYDSLSYRNMSCSGATGDDSERVTGIVDNAYYFKGSSDDWCETYNSNPFNSQGSSSNFSVSFWFNSSDTNRGMIFSNTVAGGYYGFAVHLTNNGGIDGFIREQSGGDSIELPETSAKYNDSQWHFAVLIYNYTSSNDQSLYLYVDDMTTPASFGTETAGLIDWEFGDRNLRFGNLFGFSNWQYDGYVDEWGFFKHYVLDEDDREFLYNNGNPDTENQYPFANNKSYSITTAEPLSSQLNSSLNSNEWTTEFIILANKTIKDCDVNVSGWNKIRNSGSSFRFFIPQLNDSNTSYTFECEDYFDQNRTISFWINYDNVDPTITLYEPLNGTTISTDWVLVNATYFDFYLWKTNSTLFDPNGNQLYNDYSGELGGDTSTYELVFNYSTLVDGSNYRLFLQATDTHTRKEFKETPRISELSRGQQRKATRYELSRSVLDFETDDDTTINSYKATDRIKQEFVTTDRRRNAQKTLKVQSSSGGIVYLPDSPYPCHLIINDDYWWDCIGMPNAQVTQYTSSEVEIRYDNSADTFMTESLGGTNQINKSFYFDVVVTEPTPNGTTTINQTNIIQFPDEIGLSFGNTDVLFSAMLLMFCGFISIRFSNSLFFMFTIIAGLVFMTMLWVYTDINFMLKFLVTGILSVMIFQIRENFIR